MVCVPNFYLAGGLVELGMSWQQGVATVFAANLLTLLPMVLVATPGTVCEPQRRGLGTARAGRACRTTHNQWCPAFMLTRPAPPADGIPFPVRRRSAGCPGPCATATTGMGSRRSHALQVGTACMPRRPRMR